MKKFTALTLTLSLLLTLVACGGSSSSTAPAASTADSTAAASAAAPAAPAGKTQIMTIGTADSGGAMYPIGCTLAKVVNDNVPGVKINAETSAGSPANAVNLKAGEIELGMMAGDVAYQAYNGVGKFADNKCEGIRALAACYPSVSQWIVLESSGLTDVDALASKKLAIGPSASATAIAANAAITAAGITPTSSEYLGLTEGADAVGDGVLDAAHAFSGLPVGGFLNLTNIKPSRILGYSDATLDKVIAGNSSYYKAVIPAKTYNNQAEDINTFGVKAMVCVTDQMDDEMAYQMAKALYENPTDLVAGHAALTAMTADPSFICNDLPIPLHPGAERFYKEVGLLK